MSDRGVRLCSGGFLLRFWAACVLAGGWCLRGGLVMWVVWFGGLSWVLGLGLSLCVVFLLCLFVLLPALGLAFSINTLVLGFCSVLLVCRFWFFEILVIACVYSGRLLVWVWGACMIGGGW